MSVQVAVGRIAPGQVALALDGKVLRGSRDTGGAVHLFTALLHGEALVTGRTGHQQAGDSRRSRHCSINSRRVLMHHRRIAHGSSPRTVLRIRGAFYVFTVKGNTPALFGKMPWAGRRSRSAGRPRTSGTAGTESAAVKVMPAPPGLRLPGAAQVMLIEHRHRPENREEVRGGGAGHHQPHRQANPEQLAALIEATGRSKPCTGSGLGQFREDCPPTKNRDALTWAPSLRNLAINALRLAGEPIAAGRQWATSDYRNPLSLLGLTM